MEKVCVREGLGHIWCYWCGTSSICPEKGWLQFKMYE